LRGHESARGKRISWDPVGTRADRTSHGLRQMHASRGNLTPASGFLTRRVQREMARMVRRRRDRGTLGRYRMKAIAGHAPAGRRSRPASAAVFRLVAEEECGFTGPGAPSPAPDRRSRRRTRNSRALGRLLGRLRDSAAQAGTRQKALVRGRAGGRSNLGGSGSQVHRLRHGADDALPMEEPAAS
jgi:hypothetical protein